MNRSDHWEKIYAEKAADQVGWYTPRLETSLQRIAGLGLDPADPIIDVGGGASTLIDDLLAAGHGELSVLDLSASALATSQRRLGDGAAAVTWIHGDVTEVELPASRYRLWHDRAVFHFLVDAKARRKYREQLLHALQADGYVVMGCFAPEAPPTCSGLPVQRYTAEELARALGKSFELKHRNNEVHTTPAGMKQAYVYCLFQRSA